jgi:phenylpyruvate tautomerase PptA (4-oxalocrotonate tautomerase family)
MTTYNRFTSPGKLTPAQNIAKDDWFIAGEAARPDLVWIRFDVREGRNEEMKARLLHRVQQGIAKVVKIPEESIWFYLCDLPSMNIMEWAQIMPPLRAMPDDDVVFNALSAPLQASLSPLAQRRRQRPPERSGRRHFADVAGVNARERRAGRAERRFPRLRRALKHWRFGACHRVGVAFVKFTAQDALATDSAPGERLHDLDFAQYAT